MSVNDIREMGTLGRRLNLRLCGQRLNSPKVVVDSACVVKPLNICSRGDRIPWKTLEVMDTHYLASQQEILKAKADLVFVSEATPRQWRCAALPRFSRNRDSLRTNHLFLRKEAASSSA